MALADTAGWIALVATCVAALMTASNLGARLTGWGFVVFTIGAIAWSTVGLLTHATQLLYSNLFLGVVDIVGAWRWLGHRARLADVATAEERKSHQREGEDLFSFATLDGMTVTSVDGQVVAHVVDALTACEAGRIAFLIVRVGGVGGVGESLHRLPWKDASIADGAIKTRLDAATISQLPKAIER